MGDVIIIERMHLKPEYQQCVSLLGRKLQQ